ncbi:MAG: fatty acid desaturase [Anaerolineaceae bacterium]|nr:fatty acid desaturase [Anaerolineaceae bacterium]
MADLQPLAYAASDVPSHAEARTKMLNGYQTEFAALRVIDSGERFKEMGIFLALFAAGMGLNLLGILDFKTLPGLIMRISGTLVTTLAVNSFVLLMHEGMHYVLFKNRTANRWVSVALGATFLMSYTSYRVLHTRHHRYLGDRRDPDDYENYAGRPGLVWLMQYLRLSIGAVVYIFMIPFLAWRYANSTERRDILVEYAILIPIYGILLMTLPGKLLVEVWFVPLLLTGWMTAVRGLSQHGVTNTRDPYLASRSIEASRPVRFFMLNENYHLEHHLFPEIPSYHLGAAHQLIDPSLPRRVSMSSYLGFLLRFFVQSLSQDNRPIGLKDPAVS